MFNWTIRDCRPRRVWLLLALVLAASALSLTAAHSGKALYCDVEYRSCASDSPPGGIDGAGGSSSGTAGGVLDYGYAPGDHLPGTPDSLQAAGWECTNWFMSCHDDGTSVGLKKCDSVNRYRAHCSITMMGRWWCVVDTVEPLGWWGC